MKKSQLWLALLMVAVFALSRWPGLMPLNFSAAYAFAFCAGLYFPGRVGWIFSLGLMAGTDLVLNRFFYTHDHFSMTGFLAGEAPIFLAYAALIGLGRAFGAKRSWWMLLGGGLMGAIIFYVVTNTAAWMALPYAKTLTGWIQAVTTGLPGFPQTWEFFRNTLLSGGLFTGLFVGAMKLTEEPETEMAEEGEGEPSGERDPETAEAEP